MLPSEEPNQNWAKRLLYAILSLRTHTKYTTGKPSTTPWQHKRLSSAYGLGYTSLNRWVWWLHFTDDTLRTLLVPRAKELNSQHFLHRRQAHASSTCPKLSRIQTEELHSFAKLLKEAEQPEKLQDSPRSWRLETLRGESQGSFLRWTLVIKSEARNLLPHLTLSYVERNRTQMPCIFFLKGHTHTLFHCPSFLLKQRMLDFV